MIFSCLQIKHILFWNFKIAFFPRDTLFQHFNNFTAFFVSQTCLVTASRATNHCASQPFTFTVHKTPRATPLTSWWQTRRSDCTSSKMVPWLRRCISLQLLRACVPVTSSTTPTAWTAQAQEKKAQEKHLPKWHRLHRIRVNGSPPQLTNRSPWQREVAPFSFSRILWCCHIRIYRTQCLLWHGSRPSVWTT